MYALVNSGWRSCLLLILVLFARNAFSQSDISETAPVSTQSTSLVSFTLQATVTGSVLPAETFAVDGLALDNATYRIQLKHFDDDTEAELEADLRAMEAKFDSGVIWASAQCWYPLSSFYYLFPRALFYVVLLFALVAQDHEWIIIGALATGMTYASVVAVHALIMTWSGHVYGNIDFGAAIGLLSFSAAIVVPLLNWSKKIKEIGKSKGEDAAGRSLILYWSVLIFVALFSQLIAIWTLGAAERLRDIPTQVLGAYISVEANTDSITCSPPNGVMNLTAGQNHGYANLMVSQEFMKDNNCHNPCERISLEDTHWATTRAFEDLKPMSQRAMATWLYPETNGNQYLRHKITPIAAFFSAGTVTIAFVIGQGLLAILGGRRWPVQLRNWAYWNLRPKQRQSGLQKAQVVFAQGVGWGLQALAWVSSIYSVLLIPLTVGVTEYVMHEFDQPYNFWVIDQWGPWVSTGIVIAGALLYRCQNIVRKHMDQWQARKKGLQRPDMPTNNSDTETLAEQKPRNQRYAALFSFVTRPGVYWRARWDSIVNFWKDPDFWAEKDLGEWGLDKSGSQIEREKTMKRQTEKV